MKRMPKLNSETRLLIVCEGSEEYDYLDRLKQCKVWNSNYCIKIKDAKSIDNIAALYEYWYQSGTYVLVVVFCDTEKYPYVQYNLLKEKINKFHGAKVADKIVFFANPCSMQIILSHFNNVSLKTNDKTENGELIKRLTGVKNYEASEQQRRAITNKINKQNYATMKKNISTLSSDFNTVPSSNVLQLFNALEKDDKKWISLINKKLEK